MNSKGATLELGGADSKPSVPACAATLANTAVAVPALRSSANRDPRIDVLRGLALLMIFVDHIPQNVVSKVTLGQFGFSDAAEVFVLLAGVSSTLAYGKVFERGGFFAGFIRVAARLGRLYVFQIALVLATVGIVVWWSAYADIPPTEVAPLQSEPVTGLLQTLALHAVPGYLDILPLYIILLALFPFIHFGLRRAPWLTLGVSAALWLVANLDGSFNLPNWMDDQQWFFNPFAWQFLFTIGAALAIVISTHGGALPRVRWLTWVCLAYLTFALVASAPWANWGLPTFELIDLPSPDKTNLSFLRLLDVLALAYLILSSSFLRKLSGHGYAAFFRMFGRHSLEVFAVGCLLALVGRLLFTTVGAGLQPQIFINAAGLITMAVVARWLDSGRTPQPTAPAVA